jgi:hypothetical protein
MRDLLQEELTGPSVKVRLRGAEFPLLYSMHAVILYKQKTGDSLFIAENFKKIDLGEDPERWLACLWAGLHSQDKGEWRAPFTIDDLQGMIDFSNAGEVSVAMAKALTQSMPKPRKEDSRPNADAPAAMPAPESTPANSISDGSMLEPVAASVSPAASS